MKKIILLVEDDKILQENIKTALERAEFEVAQLFSGKNFEEKIKKIKPQLILLDLMLPEVDGYHILKKLKANKELEKIPVIILTIIQAESSLEECKMLGAVDYLIKSDYSLKEIIKKVEKILK